MSSGYLPAVCWCGGQFGVPFVCSRIFLPKYIPARSGGQMYCRILLPPRMQRLYLLQFAVQFSVQCCRCYTGWRLPSRVHLPSGRFAWCNFSSRLSFRDLQPRCCLNRLHTVSCRIFLRPCHLRSRAMPSWWVLPNRDKFDYSAMSARNLSRFSERFVCRGLRSLPPWEILSSGREQFVL